MEPLDSGFWSWIHLLSPVFATYPVSRQAHLTRWGPSGKGVGASFLRHLSSGDHPHRVPRASPLPWTPGWDASGEGTRQRWGGEPVRLGLHQLPSELPSPLWSVFPPAAAGPTGHALTGVFSQMHRPGPIFLSPFAFGHTLKMPHNDLFL